MKVHIHGGVGYEMSLSARLSIAEDFRGSCCDLFESGDCLAVPIQRQYH